jgi:hypothetical protein
LTTCALRLAPKVEGSIHLHRNLTSLDPKARINYRRMRRATLNGDLLAGCQRWFPLQLDVNDRYPTEDKKRLAARLCDTYSRMMSVGGRCRMAQRGGGDQSAAKQDSGES